MGDNFFTFLFLAFFSLLTVPSKAIEEESGHEHEPLLVYAIPGQNGYGSESGYIKTVLGGQTNVVKEGTPETFPDLGQYFCERHLDKAFQENDNKEGVIYATSQGTTTALNYVSKSGNSKKVTVLVLEAVLASGNDAIWHTAKGPLMQADTLMKIPGARYFAPYIVAGLICRGYRPAGQQAIKSIDNLPKELPIIIVHSEDDMQLPFGGACALYYRLRQNGNNNVYLVSVKGDRHIQILDEGRKDIVRHILKKHLNKMHNDNNSVDLQSCQPDHTQFKKDYDELMATENKHVRLERLGLLGIAVGLSYAAKCFLGSK